jgi:cystathionine beta-lyase
MGEAFSHGQPWLDAAIELNRTSRDLLFQLLDTQAPQVKYWVPQAGFLAWLDVSALKIGISPAAKSLEEQKVAFVPGEELGKAHSQYLRLNFACHPDSLKRAVKALAAYAN